MIQTILLNNDTQDTVPQSIVDIQNKLSQFSSFSDVKEMKKQFNEFLEINAWALNVCIANESKINISALKNRVGMCFQTGNMSRYYPDVMKLELLYRKNKIDFGILILPSKELAKKIGDNIVNSDRVLNELKVFEEIITLPLAIIELSEEV